MTARVVNSIGFDDGFAGNTENPNSSIINQFQGMEKTDLLRVYGCGYAKGVLRRYRQNRLNY